MRLRLLIVVLVGVMVLVAACNTDRKSDSPVEDFNPVGGQAGSFVREQTSVALAGGNETATASVLQTLAAVTPSPTRRATPNPDFIVTFTPVPTILIQDEDDLLGNTYVDASWKQLAFTLVNDGSEFVLNDFTDRVMVVMLYSTTCGECVDQLQILRETARIFVEGIEGDNKPLFLVLNLNTSITNESLNFHAQQNGYAADNNLNWLVGSASPALRAAVGNVFGEDVYTTRQLQVVFIDLLGASHIADATRFDATGVRDVIIYYITRDTPEEEEPS